MTLSLCREHTCLRMTRAGTFLAEPFTHPMPTPMSVTQGCYLDLVFLWGLVAHPEIPTTDLGLSSPTGRKVQALGLCTEISVSEHVTSLG